MVQVKTKMRRPLTLITFTILCLTFLYSNASPASRAVLEEDDTSPSYAPQTTPCPPGTTLVRPATSLSVGESNYITSRRSGSSPRSQSLLGFLKTANLGFSQDELESYVSNTTTALAFSGGGYRAMLNAAGIFNSLDSRTSTSPNFSGLLQGMDYLAGLSGGNWMVGSTALNDFATIQSLLENNWQLGQDLIAPGPHWWDDVWFLHSLRLQVEQKASAGFNTTLTDYWGLALGRQLITRGTGGVDMGWSDIRHMKSFQNMSMPFPIVVADGRKVGEILAPINATIYEFNPFEFGSWDLQLFSPIEYLGTTMNNGSPVGQCVIGFDYAGFLMGTSSSVFNGIVAEVGNSTHKELREVLAWILDRLDKDNYDIANYPNPFHGYNPGKNPVAPDQMLQLADGGEDQQNIPLWPLLQPQRQVDVILAVDSSDDKNNWPNGNALVSTYLRTINESYTDTISFPPVPDTDTFVALGLNQKPTFFGCDGRNHTGSGSPPPLIVYLPNTPLWGYSTNTPTKQLTYNETQINDFIDNGKAQVEQGGKSDWNQCLACAILQRARERSGNVVGFGEGKCKDCFDFYCWNGTTVGKSQTYESHLKNEVYQQQKELHKGE